MSAGSHRGGRRPDFSSSNEWSQFVRPEYRNLEIERQIMQNEGQLGSFIEYINNLQQRKMSLNGGGRAQDVDGGIQNIPELVQLDQIETEAEIANEKRMKAAAKSVLKRDKEVNGTKDVDLTLRLWFKDE